jgi:outer membrane protein assembly factor BamB
VWLEADEQQSSDGGRLIRHGMLHALDVGTGSVRWRIPLGELALPGGVAVRGRAVFTSTPAARFDLGSGSLVWQAATVGTPVGGPLLSPPGDLVYIGLADIDRGVGRIVALDTDSGTERWHASLGDDSLNPTEAPWLSRSTLVVPSVSGRIIALDAATGTERWRHAPAVRRFGGITVDDAQVWLTQENGRVIVLDVESGVPVKRYNTLDASLPGRARPRPARVGDSIIIPMDHVLLGFEVAPPGR